MRLFAMRIQRARIRYECEDHDLQKGRPAPSGSGAAFASSGWREASMPTTFSASGRSFGFYATLPSIAFRGEDDSAENRESKARFVPRQSVDGTPRRQEGIRAATFSSRSRLPRY